MKKICNLCGKRYNPDTVSSPDPEQFCSEKCYKITTTEDNWVKKYDAFIDDATRRDMMKNPEKYYQMFEEGLL